MNEKFKQKVYNDWDKNYGKSVAKIRSFAFNRYVNKKCGDGRADNYIVNIENSFRKFGPDIIASLDKGVYGIPVRGKYPDFNDKLIDYMRNYCNPWNAEVLDMLYRIGLIKRKLRLFKLKAGYIQYSIDDVNRALDNDIQFIKNETDFPDFVKDDLVAYFEHIKKKLLNNRYVMNAGGMQLESMLSIKLR